MNLSVLPSLLASAILVAVFRAILRQEAREETGLWMHLWLTGWILVLVHFVAQFVDVGQGLWSRATSAISLGALEWASIAFLISVSPVATNRRRQLLLAAVIGVPANLYTNAVIWDVSAHSFYYGVIAVAVLCALSLLWNLYRAPTAYEIGLSIGCLGLSCAMVAAVARGRPELGIILILAALNFIVAMLYWRRFRRATLGVLTTVFGFVAWGAVFPTGTLLVTFAPSVHVESEVWNIPKYFVAVGMILTLLSRQIEQLSAAVEDDLPALIAQGERGDLEFKPSFRWDLRQSRVNHALEVAVVKTLAGFMNRDGGSLVIGVADDGSIVGLEHDYKTLKKPDRDGFELTLMTAIATNLGGDVCYTVQMLFRSLENKDVCRVIVSPAHRPVSFKDGRPIEFYSCFISYSTLDQQFAERLRADLRAEGVRCWFAPDDVKSGRKLHEQIDEAIRLHDKVLLILSQHSMNSAWVKTEIANARAREDREKMQLLFPITLVPFEEVKKWKLLDADCGIDSAREIREYFIPDFSNWKNHESYQVAFDRLLKDLKAEASK